MEWKDGFPVIKGVYIWETPNKKVIVISLKQDNANIYYLYGTNESHAFLASNRNDAMNGRHALVPQLQA